MKINTKDLTGAALDWAVAKCLSVRTYISPDGQILDADLVDMGTDGSQELNYSSRWALSGPIIEREISKLFKNVGGTYSAQIRHEENHPLVSHKVLAGWTNASGPTMLIAAMRCYAASKLGDEIDMPEELLK